MRATVGIPLLTGLGLVTASLAGGCSGAGAPPEAPELASLRALANDQVASVALIKQWFPVLYPVTGPPRGQFTTLPAEPDDPPGLWRYRIDLEDGTTILGIQQPDHSGHEVATLSDGRQREISWSSAQHVGPWSTYRVTKTFWDGTRMEYEMGGHDTSPLFDHFYRGTITLADGQTAGHFSHDRNLERDLLELRLSDGARLSVTVPLHSTADQGYWPAFVSPAEGIYRAAGQGKLALTLSGTVDAGWERWGTRTNDGVVGAFALQPDLAGAGELTEGPDLLALFRWTADGIGALEPVAASGFTALPSAATRDFAIDQWIRRIDDMRPGS